MQTLFAVDAPETVGVEVLTNRSVTGCHSKRGRLSLKVVPDRLDWHTVDETKLLVNVLATMVYPKVIEAIFAKLAYARASVDIA